MVVTELQRAKLLRAVYSERQLYEVMVDFWENHFSIFANKDDDRYLRPVTIAKRFGRLPWSGFRDLLGATAHSPAMSSIWITGGRACRVLMRQPKTSLPVLMVVSTKLRPRVNGVSHAGRSTAATHRKMCRRSRVASRAWTIQKPNEQGLFYTGPDCTTMVRRSFWVTEFFPAVVPADGERVLDILAKHPATARFIATKLARRFISDEPPPSIIDRAAAVFLKTDGSIRETLRAIITSPEFFSPAAYRAKMRSPFEYVAASMRALNAETDGDRPVLSHRRMATGFWAHHAGRLRRSRGPVLASGAMIVRFNFRQRPGHQSDQGNEDRRGETSLRH